MNPLHILGVLLLLAVAAKAEEGEFFKFFARDIHGKNVSMETYRGNVTIVVNVASLSLLAETNYSELEELYLRYGESRGLRILAFPCNQFAHQEPGLNEDIYEWARENYHVTFDMFGKTDVNGKNALPLWIYLQNKLPGFLWNAIKWNYTKFLIDRNGNPYKRFSPRDTPLSMLEDIEKLWFDE